MIRVALADDQAMIRAGLRMVLETEPDLRVVAEAADGADALAVTRRTQPDVVLLDIAMPRLDGLAAARRIAALPAPPRIIMLTTFDSDDNLYAALRAGASGFLLKVSPPEQLVAAIRVVAGGAALLDPAVTTRVIAAFAHQPAPQPPPELAQLTPRELDVLRLLARGLSNAEIADRLTLGEATVKTHVARVLMKLGLRDRVQAVVYAYENGVIRVGG
ncbi:response regulator transcription factor [Phytohabitans sp. ZYX-F-186]|uniref:Response regulator transcription factor n=1 Tax=Phytohabitans maris TaxID=3071409 RepID=A0ABU0ZF67_9ACTN|nr:response regulator transcription factor [Phytohabitans sp. ZYX-F-186]MDQ7904997.1 response regulator transcription factor [Phytohabitans sp. ZYX-F-186]